MRIESDPAASYDSVPYSSYPYAKSHPRNLAALGTLFGMTPPDVSNCRVLEIGCAGGGNLVPMAVGLPNARFVGIDASAKQIHEGHQVIADLQLDNISLHNQDVLAFDPHVGPFDYIICHGVYSWVSPQVQRKILDVCRDHLTPQGIAYVSYNTYPGWYLRRGVREMMSYHAAGFDDTQSRIDQSRALLNFLNRAVGSDGGAYEMLLREELDVLKASEDSYLFHEHLEHWNEPVFFHQFVDWAKESGLRFLSEAHFGSMMAHEFDEEIQNTLREIAPDIVRMEQYLDFLRNRKFRQTLLCHQKTDLTRSIDPASVRSLFVATQLAPTDSSPPQQDDGDRCENEMTFAHPSGRNVTVSIPFLQSAFMHLARCWPSEISLAELSPIAAAQTTTGPPSSPEERESQLAETMLECYSSDLVDLFTSASAAVATPGRAPKVAELTRYFAVHRDFVVNARHETVRIGDFDRELIQYLDGSNTVADLTERILPRVAADEVTIEGVSNPTKSDVANAVERSLNQFARFSLLIS